MVIRQPGEARRCRRTALVESASAKVGSVTVGCLMNGRNGSTATAAAQSSWCRHGTGRRQQRGVLVEAFTIADPEHPTPSSRSSRYSMPMDLLCAAGGAGSHVQEPAARPDQIRYVRDDDGITERPQQCCSRRTGSGATWASGRTRPADGLRGCRALWVTAMTRAVSRHTRAVNCRRRW